MDLQEMRSLGGKARAERLTPEQRKKIASKAGKASARVARRKKREAKRQQKNKERG